MFSSKIIILFMLGLLINYSSCRAQNSDRIEYLVVDSLYFIKPTQSNLILLVDLDFKSFRNLMKKNDFKLTSAEKGAYIFMLGDFTTLTQVILKTIGSNKLTMSFANNLNKQFLFDPLRKELSEFYLNTQKGFDNFLYEKDGRKVLFSIEKSDDSVLELVNITVSN